MAGLLSGLLLMLRSHYASPYRPPTRYEHCGCGESGHSSLPQPWRGSEEEELFARAFAVKEAEIQRLSQHALLGCSGAQPALCFRCSSIGLNDKCAYHDWRSGWSWTADLRHCLASTATRPTDAFYHYLVNASTEAVE